MDNRSTGIENVLFDLDGTLSDNSEGIIEGLNRAMDSLGLPPLDEDAVSRAIGPPLHDVMTEQLGVPEDRVEQAISAYRAYYSTEGLHRNELYPGIIDVLDALRSEGFRLAVATSKPEVFAVPILERFGISDRFDAIGAASLDTSRREKTEVIRHVNRMTGFDPATTVMVGDRSHDIQGARQAGLRCSVGVLWGFGGREELEQAGAARLAASPAELARLLLDVI
ncbi:MAG TPA: HAD family hydrolase [Acidimicrobiales bacterium]|nr:HAD family hydrolase [Acidimicrobiales bacterium]